MKIEIRNYYYIKGTFWKIIFNDPLWYDGKSKLDKIVVDLLLTAKTKPTCFPEKGI
jgi:hypothetical protein